MARKAKADPKRGRVVPYLGLVTWLDATRTDESVRYDHPLTSTRRTLGWILRDDEEGIVIAMTNDDEGFERGFGIPRAYVKTVQGVTVQPEEN
jgi:hypothetical protein